MEKTVIDGFLDRFAQLRSFLSDEGEVSLAIEAETNFKKLFVMTCGSFFEDEITSAIGTWVDRTANEDLAAFVRNKGLKRQYHTFFDWQGSKNVNSFLGLFGDAFKTKVSARIGSNKDLAAGVDAFLDLGRTRNRLAHENMASATVDKTLEELEKQYRAALVLTRFLTAQFRDEESSGRDTD